MEEDLRQLKINDVAKTLMNIGIQMYELDGSYRPFNEVMTDLGKTIKQMRDNTTDRRNFEIMRDYILTKLVGIRYKNQFMC